MKPILLLIGLLASTLAFGQDEVKIAPEGGHVTVSSKGQDVRSVLFDLFSQAKKNFVLEPNTRFVLYLALAGVPFDEALEIICHSAGLKYELTNDIYYISKIDVASFTKPTNPAPVTVPKVLGKLTDQDLQKTVTTKLSRADIRQVFTEFSSQSGVTIEVDKKVPAYKVDAFLVKTSLKYALDVVTKAAGLTIVRTDNKTLRIELKAKA